MFIFLAVLGLVTALVVVPVNTTPLDSHPHPIAEYADAISYLETMQREEHDTTLADGGSLVLVHGAKTPRAVLLVHGLTNSPRQFRELGEQLYARGYNVYVPRLPKHGLRGADIELLATLTAEQYRDMADRAVDAVAGLGDSAMVIGLSAGADVALWIAEHRADVSRVVIVAPAISLARIPEPLDAPAMNLMVRLPNFTIHQKPDTLRPHAYFGISTRALGETLRFGATVVRRGERFAPLVRDLVVVVNGNDHTVDSAPVLRLARIWRDRDGAQVTTYRFDPTLLLPHDVIDITQSCGMTEVVYPTLIALLERRAPDAIAAPPRCGQAAVAP